MLSSGSTEYDNPQHHNSHTNSALDGQYGTHPVVGIENSYLTSERRTFRDDDVSRMERKRKVCTNSHISSVLGFKFL